LVKQIKPNFKALGPVLKRHGFDFQEIQSFSAVILINWKNGTIEVVISGKSITLTMEDVEISSQDIEGWLVANSNGITVALDIVISRIEKKKELRGN
jgi:isoleucyl-tRNA synthetase